MNTITPPFRKPDYTLQVSFAVGYLGSIPTKVVPCSEGALILEVKPPQARIDERVVGFAFTGQEQDGVLAEPRKWRDPPHVAIANWQFDSAESVCTFVKRYGVLLFKGQVPKVLRPSDLHTYQELLRAGWRATSEDTKPADASDAVAVLERQFSFEELRNPWSKQNYITLHEPWSLACFLFLADLAEGKLAVCPNLDCVTRYFIKSRSDQQFCSPECRNHVNVQRWRSVPKNQKRERVARKRREGRT